ncbi:hypothetical protein [Polaribacter sp. L3A8]|uniref:hypothetical protein n=1 Tax=Polaribacter sp. L3A8 TaxID=2686361 RepID=UPI00131AD6BC|nr:hypothetical protein [Polaribacter sp. L3A8]
MKTIKTILASAIIILSITLQSCSSNDNDSEPLEETYIKFTAGAETFNYTNVATAGSQNLTINGQDGSVSSISIWFPLQITTGTFNFSGDFFADGDYKINFESTSLNIDGWSESGSVTITNVSSEYIEGTFTGTVDGVAITSGEFRAFNL